MIPSVVAMIVFSLYTMVDGFMVSYFVGERALSSVNLSMPFINSLFAIAIIFAVGVQTICGVLMGKKEIKRANEVFSMVIVSVGIISIFLAFISYVNLNNIAYLLGANEEFIDYVIEYLSIIILFSPFFILSYIFEVLVKVDGFPKIATLGVVISAITNLVLDYIFVGIFHWSVKGAAFATGIAQLLSFIIFLLHFIYKSKNLKLIKFDFEFKVLIKVSRLGIGDFISELGLGINILFYNLFLIRYLGNEAIGTFSVISYVNQVVGMCYVGVTQGIQPLVSYYYGAKDLNGYRKMFKYSVITIFCISIISLLISNIYGYKIFYVFLGRDYTHIDKSILALRKFSLSFLIAGFNILIAGFTVSLLRASYAIIINTLRYIVFLFGSLLLMANINPNNIWYSSLICEMATFVVSLFLMLRLINNSYKK